MLHVRLLHAQGRAMSEMVMLEIDEIMHNVKGFQKGNSNVYKYVR